MPFPLSQSARAGARPACPLPQWEGRKFSGFQFRRTASDVFSRNARSCHGHFILSPGYRPKPATCHAASSSLAECSARTASSTYSSPIRTLTLISEVEITWMLMPFSDRVRFFCCVLLGWVCLLLLLLVSLV